LLRGPCRLSRRGRSRRAAVSLLTL